MDELNIFRNLTEEKCIKLMKNCKKLCKKLKELYTIETQKDFISKFKKVKSEYLSVLHYYCLYLKNNEKTYQNNFFSILLSFFSSIFYTPCEGTVTLTYGDVVESHVGMQNIGKKSLHGFLLKDIRKAEKYFNERGFKTIVICLNDFLRDNVDDEEEKKHLEIAKKNEDFQAYLMIVPEGLKCLINDEKGKELTTETQFFTWDTQYYDAKKEKVLNKNARHNLNFSYEKQEADFDEGKGTTIPFEEVPLIYELREKLHDAFGDAAKDLQCEGNLYYGNKDKVSTTGIGYHGDTERRKVIGVRLGKSMNIHYQWYYNDRPRSVNISTVLPPGSIYCMSEKTVGTDWRPNIQEGYAKKRYVLRHAAGAKKYTTQTPKLNVTNLRPTPLYEGVIIGDVTFKEKKKKKSKESDDESD